MKFTFSAFFILAFLAVHAQSEKAKAVVSKLSTEEKINLVVGMGMKMPGAPGGAPALVGQTMDKVPGAAGTTFAIPAQGIPNTVVADGPAGLRINPTRETDRRTYYATAWPVATLLASSWDTALVKQVGASMGNEVKEYGVDLLLAPGMNIQRNPLGGRNFEYYSEDPVLSGNIAAAMVNGIQSNGVGTSIKHFAANNQETNRNTVDVVVSERALREIYLKGFEIAVKKARPWTVMSSYNYINGHYASESPDLLTTLLRREWGYKGMVMTDWFGGKDAVAQMKAGNDLLMPGTDVQKNAIRAAITDGSLSMDILNQNAARILDYVFLSPAYSKYGFSNKPDLTAHATVARKAAADGMVLLKNENEALPLSKNTRRIAAFGNTSYDLVSGGTGSGDVNEAYTISLVQGLAGAGYSTTPALQHLYENYVTAEKAKQPKKSFLEEFVNPTPRIPELALSADQISGAADEADIALITLGRNAGEGSDRKVENNFNLTAAEQQLIEEVSNAFHARRKKVIVIINSGGIIEVASWRNKADAILLAWQPGQEGGNAIADILDGRVNPSGKLTATFPVMYADVPSAAGWPGVEFPEKATTSPIGMHLVPAIATYTDGIYVGYRYYTSFQVKPAYEFGYGLSYTHFRYSAITSINATAKNKFTITVMVTNTGKVAGREIVQCYISAPAGKMQKPAEELKAFAKTKLLAPGQSEKISFTLTPADLASFDTEATAWVADAGVYNIRIGASSADIRQTTQVKLNKAVVTEKCNKILVPEKTISEMHR